MAMQTQSEQLLSEINVTPFVDVMLVLLIIFMVSAPMMTQGVDVALPKAVSSPLPSESDELMITVRADGHIFINELQTPLAVLRDRLTEILVSRPDRRVFFRADQSISYGDAIRIMAEIKAAGVTELGMVTEPPEKPADGGSGEPVGKTTGKIS